MASHETDYLIIGAGAVGLAFADTLLAETDAHITLIDRHGKPGGHWNDAYPFVALHQPSAFYGVNSMPLGTNRKDTFGSNEGCYELASGAEVSSYFDKVMHQSMLPSGRVSYYPMSNYLGDGRFVSLLSGNETHVTVRKKTVDATYYGTTVPSTHTPKYKVADDAWLVTPNGLAQLWQGKQKKPKQFAIIGAGKTAMDVSVWLINSGALPDSISWVMPRDSWLINRLTTQPGMEFFDHAIGGQAMQMEAFAKATSVDDLFERLEACEVMLRIYPDHKPSMFHYATMSKGEIEVLRKIKNVIRLGHVQAVGRDALQLERGSVALAQDTVCIDCTASAVERRPTLPIFQGDKLTLQLVRMPLATFSAALVAYVEAHHDDDAVKNKLCTPVPFPDGLSMYPRSTMVSMMNQLAWNQDKTLRTWIHHSRLDGFGKIIASVDPTDFEKMTILEKFKNNAKAAMANLPKLMAEA
ncbi:MAG: NAD(P)-binding protein [Chitinophagaceae bacterium]|nr:NAD(P)-binding protein [Polaromonas sp.]